MPNNELEQEAKKRLVAASHDLLEACKLMERFMQSLPPPKTKAEIENRLVMQSKIAKALDKVEGITVQREPLPSDAIDALRYSAGIWRDHNLLSTATEETRKATLNRFYLWWNFIVLPVFFKDQAPAHVQKDLAELKTHALHKWEEWKDLK